LAYLRVLMIREVSQATQAPVSKPNRSRMDYMRVLIIIGASQATHAQNQVPKQE
jgi:hypothetical protein